MANKLFIHFFFIAFAFFAVWFSLSQINFIDDEDNRFIKRQEKKLGELLIRTIKNTEGEVESKEIKAILDSIGKIICEPSGVAFDSIKVHIIRNSEINAFALPDRHMVVYTGLLEYANSAEEVAGVMAHEIGHMEKDHVMKKLIKEIGMSMLFTIAGGDSGFEILKETSRVLSSSAFDRSQEREADAYAIDMLAKAGVDPEHFGNIMFRIGMTQNLPEELVWISTHPDSKERASDILEKKKSLEVTVRPLIHTSWEDVKKMLHEDAGSNY